MFEELLNVLIMFHVNTKCETILKRNFGEGSKWTNRQSMVSIDTPKVETTQECDQIIADNSDEKNQQFSTKNVLKSN